MLYVTDDQHVLLNKRILRFACLSLHTLLPVLYLCLIVHRSHDLLLHGEAVDVLFLQGVDEKLNAFLAVLGFHESPYFLLH